MTVVRRFVSGIVASIVLLPSLAFASPDAELSLVQKLLGIELPAELKQYTHLSNGYRCNPWRFLRTPKQVMIEHQQALLAGDLDRAMCDYAPNARVPSIGYPKPHTLWTTCLLETSKFHSNRRLTCDRRLS